MVRAGESPFDVLLTTYTLFERDSTDCKLDRSFLRKWGWGYLVMDEAHALKNRDSIRSRKLRAVAECCSHRIMLTGTPLQNDLQVGPTPQHPNTTTTCGYPIR